MDDRAARTRLEAELARIDELAHSVEDDLASLDRGPRPGTASPDERPGHDAHDLLDLEVEEVLLDGLEADRAALVAALARLDAGTYGRCLTCGEAIPDERLEAIPAAAYCTQHQGAAELSGSDLPGFASP